MTVFFLERIKALVPMMIVHYLVGFLAGGFFCNSIPHLASGLRGEPFPSPFAKPPGVGDSSPCVNFLWGTLNLIIGSALLRWFPMVAGFNLDSGLFLTGFVLIGIQCSRHFGQVKMNQRRRE